VLWESRLFGVSPSLASPGGSIIVEKLLFFGMDSRGANQRRPLAKRGVFSRDLLWVSRGAGRGPGRAAAARRWRSRDVKNLPSMPGALVGHGVRNCRACGNFAFC